MPLHLAPRLYVTAKLGEGEAISIPPEQAHYLKNVMRLKPGDAARLFNGRDGEWRGELSGEWGKKPPYIISIGEQLKPQVEEPDLWLCCAPIKKAHFDFLIEKATELGVGTLRPILTARTQVREVSTDRAHALAVEAAEQSERLSVPAIEKPVGLKELVAGWPADRLLIVCAEWGEAVAVKDAFARGANKAAIVTGPEGGFAADELALLRLVKNCVFIRLGPRILRADTAAIAALSCWQAMCGDWQYDSSPLEGEDRKS